MIDNHFRNFGSLFWAKGCSCLWAGCKPWCRKQKCVRSPRAARQSGLSRARGASLPEGSPGGQTSSDDRRRNRPVPNLHVLPQEGSHRRSTQFHLARWNSEGLWRSRRRPALNRLIPCSGPASALFWINCKGVCSVFMRAGTFFHFRQFCWLKR